MFAVQIKNKRQSASKVSTDLFNLKLMETQKTFTLTQINTQLMHSTCFAERHFTEHVL